MLSEYISGHNAGTAVAQAEEASLQPLVQPADRNCVDTMNVPQLRVLTRGDDLRCRLVVLVQNEVNLSL